MGTIYYTTFVKFLGEFLRNFLAVLERRSGVKKAARPALAAGWDPRSGRRELLRWIGRRSPVGDDPSSPAVRGGGRTGDSGLAAFIDPAARLDDQIEVEVLDIDLPGSMGRNRPLDRRILTKSIIMVIDDRSSDLGPRVEVRAGTMGTMDESLRVVAAR